MKRRSNRFIALLGATALLATSALAVSAQDGIDPTAEPTFATIHLGGTENFWLDPFLVSTVGGAPEGDTIDASTLGEGCVGAIPTTPDVVLNWTEDADVESLRVFFVSQGDPTMVIVTPDGSVLCNDDVNPLLLDPLIDIENPAAGNYAIFMGSFEENAVQPGFLVVTGGGLTPDTLNLSALLPARGALFEQSSIPLSTLLLDQLPAGSEAANALAAGFGTAQQTEVVSGGEIGAFNIDLGNRECTGFVNAVPTYVFEWSGDAVPLRAFFEGDSDATLIVRSPDGTFWCSDDSAGADNLNPSLDFTAAPGRYVVYVGSFAPDATVNGTLTVTEDTALAPAALTSDAIGQ